MPILDSSGQPVSITSSTIKHEYANRGKILTPGSMRPNAQIDTQAAPGNTLMSRFAGNKHGDLANFKKFAADVETANPAIRSPLLNQSNFYMPDNDASTGEPNRLLNQWILYYYKWSAMTGNILDMHSTVGETLVHTDKGILPIKQIDENYKTLSSQGIWQSIKWQEQHEFEGDLITLQATGCPKEQYTYNHPIKIKKSKRVQTRKDSNRLEPTGDSIWVDAEKVQVSDYVIFPKFKVIQKYDYIDLEPYITKTKLGNYHGFRLIGEGKDAVIRSYRGNKPYTDIPRYIPIDEDLAYVLGWYIAEGCCSKEKKNHNITLVCSSVKDPVDKIKLLLEKIFNVSVSLDSPKKSAKRLNISSSILCNFFIDTCGRVSYNKKIPDFIGLNNTNILSTFVKAYIKGDGCFRSFNTTKKDVQANTVSPTLAYQLRLYCTKLGFLFRLRRGYTKRVHSYRPKIQRETWTLTALPQEILPKLYDTKLTANRPPNIKEDKDNFYLPVRGVSKEHYKGTVYDIKTEDKSFVGNFIVHNSEIPLSRFALRGIDDPTILNFYEEMTESCELHLKMVELLRQYFMFGEVIPYAFWSDDLNSFTDLTFLDNNYVYVKGHYLLHSDEGDDVEFYELEPDPLLQQIVKSEDYVTQLLKGYLEPDFVNAVQQNKRLLLSNFSTAMIKHKSRYADLRGTSIVLRALKSLLYGDKLREAQYCHTPDTEVLTEDGFKPIAEVTTEDTVATVNMDNDFALEFHNPSETQEFDYTGKMYNFKTSRVDTNVTPNHRMVVKGSTGGWKVIRADKVKKTQKVRATVNWAGHEDITTIDICGHTIDIELWLEFGGYFVSEGYVSHTKSNRGYITGISQVTKSPDFKTMEHCLDKLPFNFKYSSNGWYVHGKELYYTIKDMFGKGCRGKVIPAWIKALSPRLLQIFLDAAVRGDDTTKLTKNKFINIAYSSISPRLADDIMEMVIKCGYATHVHTWDSTTNGNTCTMHSVCWSVRDTKHYCLSKDTKRHISPTHNGNHVQISDYSGKVYCLTVPNGVFITRRNGRIGIHGNSIADGNINPKWIWKIGQSGDLATGGYMPSEDDLAAFRDLLIQANNDPMFTIITHYAVNVDAIGLNGKLLPLKQEYDQIEDDILVALFANKAVTTGTGPNFATASVAFRAMMSRYIPIRAKVERYLYQKIFAPTAYANKFYKRTQSELDHGIRTGTEDANQLIIPDIDWRSKANLLDDGSIKSIVSTMVASGKMPMKILCESLDLDYSEVRNYLYQEQGTIFDPVTQDARKRINSQMTDETMMGQPFAPKTNQPVSVKAQSGTGAAPTAKSATTKKVRKLSMKPLNAPEVQETVTEDSTEHIQPVSSEQDIQTAINKGQVEKGGNPEMRDPMSEALALASTKPQASNFKDIDCPTGISNKPVPKIFDVLKTSSGIDNANSYKVLEKKFAQKEKFDEESKDNKHLLPLGKAPKGIGDL